MVKVVRRQKIYGRRKAGRLCASRVPKKKERGAGEKARERLARTSEATRVRQRMYSRT